MQGLTSLLPHVLRQAGDSPEAREQCVYAAWAGVVGSQVSKVTTPVGFHEKRLVVAVLDDSWRLQLKKMSAQIAFRINAVLGSAEVRTIDMAVNENKVHAAHPASATVTFLAPSEHAMPLREKAGLIPDPDLREAFLRVAGKCLERASARTVQQSDGPRTHSTNTD